MIIRENQIENKKVMQIYLSKEEKENNEVQEKIEKIKKERGNIVLFTSGDEKVEEVLKNMIMIMKKQ